MLYGVDGKVKAINSLLLKGDSKGDIRRKCIRVQINQEII